MQECSTTEGTHGLIELYEAIRGVHPERTMNDDSMERIFASDDVRTALQWELPAIEDVSETLMLTRGRVLAVRMDLLGEGTGLKQPVVAGLIARSLARVRDVLSLHNKKGFIDGASVSMGLAMAYYDKLFKTQSLLVTSRAIPEVVVRYIGEKSGQRLTVTKDDNDTPDLETALTRHFIDLLRDGMTKQYIPLFHTKHGAEVLQPYGQQCAACLPHRPDYIVTTLGAGSTLQGMAIPLRNRFSRSTIVVAEHERCALLQAPVLDIDSDEISGYHTDWLAPPVPGKRTAIIGPHENTLNPFIQKEVLEQCAVARYSDANWQQLLAHCRDKGLFIGPSSAANLFISRGIANSFDSTVVTFAVEPLRDYYLVK